MHRIVPVYSSVDDEDRKQSQKSHKINWKAIFSIFYYYKFFFCPRIIHLSLDCWCMCAVIVIVLVHGTDIPGNKSGINSRLFHVILWKITTHIGSHLNDVYSIALLWPLCEHLTLMFLCRGVLPKPSIRALKWSMPVSCRLRNENRQPSNFFYKIWYEQWLFKDKIIKFWHQQNVIDKIFGVAKVGGYNNSTTADGGSRCGILWCNKL